MLQKKKRMDLITMYTNTNIHIYAYAKMLTLMHTYCMLTAPSMMPNSRAERWKCKRCSYKRKIFKLKTESGVYEILVVLQYSDEILIGHFCIPSCKPDPAVGGQNDALTSQKY